VGAVLLVGLPMASEIDAVLAGILLHHRANTLVVWCHELD
jgi:hypothetical protein